MSWRHSNSMGDDPWRWNRGMDGGGAREGADSGRYARRPHQLRPTSPGYRSDPGDKSDYDSLYAYSPGARSDRYRSGGESDAERNWRPPSSYLAADQRRGSEWTDGLGGVPRRYDVLPNRDGDMETPGGSGRGLSSDTPGYRFGNRSADRFDSQRYEGRYARDRDIYDDHRGRHAVERFSLPRDNVRGRYERGSRDGDDTPPRHQSSRGNQPRPDHSAERAGSPRTLNEYSSFLLEEIQKTRSDNAWLQREIDVTRDDNDRLRVVTDVDSHASIQSSAVPVPPSPERTGRTAGWSQPRSGTWRIRLRSTGSGFVDIDVPEDATVAELSRMVPGGGPASLLFAGHRLPPGETLRRAGLRDGDVLDIAPPDQPPAAPPPQLPPQHRQPRAGYSPSPPPADVAAESGVVAALQDDASSVPTDASAEHRTLAALMQQEHDETGRPPQPPRAPAASWGVGVAAPEAASDPHAARRPHDAHGWEEARGEAVPNETDGLERSPVRQLPSPPRPQQTSSPPRQQHTIPQVDVEAEAIRQRAEAEAARQRAEAEAARQRAEVEAKRKKEKGAMMLAAMVRAQNQRSGASVLCYVDGTSVFKGEYVAYLDACLDKHTKALRRIGITLGNGAAPDLPPPGLDSSPGEIGAYNQQSRGCFYNVWLPLRRKLEEQETVGGG
eukprot:Hpha_TRINITY_DN8584_c0_g1::TRINITY_DN8584_c0_g1_i1::g.146490::m.146490